MALSLVLLQHCAFAPSLLLRNQGQQSELSLRREPVLSKAFHQLNDGAAASEYQRIRLQPGSLDWLQLRREILRLKNSSTGDDEAPPFKSIIGACHQVQFFHPRPRGHVDVFPRDVQHLSRKRHPVLRADYPPRDPTQCPPPVDFPVAHSLDHALRKSWHDLSMATDECPIAVEQEIRVIESAVPRPLFDPLVYTEAEHDAKFPCGGGAAAIQPGG